VSEHKFVGPCVSCQTPFYIPTSLYMAAKASSAITFYCPYGHPQVFREGPTEADKLRQERDRLTQRLAQKDDEIKHQRERAEAAERSAIARKGVVTRLKNRAAAGICPCCARSFENLRRHMAAKHPEFQAEESAA
jgi:hypothetical protein